MNKSLILSSVIALSLSLCSPFSYAEEHDEKRDIETIKSLLADKVGISASLIKKAKVSRVKDSDIYEIVIDRNIIYATKDASYLFVEGSLIDVKRQKNVTAERMEEINKVDWASLDLRNAIKVVKGKGQREIAIFSDPECPYCRQLEKEMDGLENYTAYIFMMPLKQIHPNATIVAESIWCSKDRAKAWKDYMTGKEAPEKKKCDNPIEKNIKWAEANNIFGTPAIIGKNGRVNPGFLPKAQLDKWISENSPAKMN